MFPFGTVRVPVFLTGVAATALVISFASPIVADMNETAVGSGRSEAARIGSDQAGRAAVLCGSNVETVQFFDCDTITADMTMYDALRVPDWLGTRHEASSSPVGSYCSSPR